MEQYDFPTPGEEKQELQEKLKQVFVEMGKVIVGQQPMITRLLIGLFTNGHILLEGVPGLAKTLTINTLAQTLGLKFQRIQFTPDLLPADLIGTMIFNQQQSRFEVKKGPVFANLILADEINRAPAKVQAALLEAMQEKQVTIGETTFGLEAPFLVLATQNPVEQEGTYPLPEAQVDRFMLKVFAGYPSKEEELEIMRRMTDMNFNQKAEQSLNRKDIKAIANLVNSVNISESLERYIVEIAHATRRPAEYGLKEEAQYVQFGASPRATIGLNRAAKALAFFNERDYVLPEDIKEIAPDILNHRIILNYEAEADGVQSRQIIERVLGKVAIGK